MKNIASIFIILPFVLNLSCKTASVKGPIDYNEVNNFIDQWHHAAAVADEETFFSSFTHDGIYIGTDPTEHWTARELETLFKAAFEKESAWAFTPHDRHFYTSKDGKIIWFDELLDTWMGSCRGSGVLEQENGQWKIAHYHLSVAVPNDAIPAYLKILEDNSRE